MSELSHVPVMLVESMEALNLRPGSSLVDGTLGLAGHARAFCQEIAPDGKFIGIDWDEAMLAEAKLRMAEVQGVDCHFFHADYRDIARCVVEVMGKVGVDAIFLDLGLNNAQIADPKRGISFVGEGPLDMRMDRSRGETASQGLNRWTEREIERILTVFGDENWAKKIAQVVVETRKESPLKTTQDLVDCVMRAIPPSKREKRIHPATRTFQAVRIAINGELDELGRALGDAARCLKVGGVMVVLSYHSGEDRAAKVCFKELEDEGFKSLYKKPLVPTAAEISKNNKSRSAKLRAIKRISIEE
ncbi:MAG: 16S rRNA (cytosine(1402)-N(4))-methyltransferase RsmH [Armatimonadetes bacterium]|nr:16S rRNA (cytosine(1402)-N(4))-methyltransferase RsmH [Armatimonadota bacterium]